MNRGKTQTWKQRKNKRKEYHYFRRNLVGFFWQSKVGLVFWKPGEVKIREQKRIQEALTGRVAENRLQRQRDLLYGSSKSCNDPATIFKSSFSLPTGTRMPENKGKVVEVLPGQAERSWCIPGDQPVLEMDGLKHWKVMSFCFTRDRRVSQNL